MMIPCPWCGARDAAEFVQRGDAAPQRPAYADGADAFADYVYLRTNPAGPLDEHWYHARGCGQWLIVTRDTRTHQVSSASLARRAAS